MEPTQMLRKSNQTPRTAAKPRTVNQASDDDTRAKSLIILPISEGQTSIAIVGTSPLIFNRLAHGRKELLFPSGGRKTAADRAGSLKHDPINEFRESVYRNHDGGATRLKFPCPAFKGAVMTAALDLPGTKRTEIGRLVWVDGTHVDIYGVPEMFMSAVRNSDINRTPDIRTRAICPRWACVISLHFVRPKLTGASIADLVAAAGIIAGIGDFRQEKGKGSFGQFRIAGSARSPAEMLKHAPDPEFRDVVRNGGVSAQDAALRHPRCYDADTAELFAWFEAEIKRRDRDGDQREPEPPVPGLAKLNGDGMAASV